MTAQAVGGEDHETFHRRLHCGFYLPLLRLAFGDESTWSDRRALVCFAGEGREAALLAPYVDELIVTDKDTECLTILRARFAAERRVRVLAGDGQSLIGLADQSVHLVTALVALMHIGQKAVRDGYAREIARVLAPGGRALVQVMQGTGGVDGDFNSYGAPDVGFATEDEVVTYWQQFLPVRWLLRTAPVPLWRSERCWWWVLLGTDTPPVTQ